MIPIRLFMGISCVFWIEIQRLGIVPSLFFFERDSAMEIDSSGPGYCYSHVDKLK